MKKHGLLNLILVFAFLSSNLGGIATSQTSQTKTGYALNIKGKFQALLGRVDSLFDSFRKELFDQKKNIPEGISPTATPTPGFGIVPTPTLTKTIEPTLSPTAMPTETITPTLTPTEPFTPTATPPPEGGFPLATIDVNLDPDPAAPGDVVTATWTINNYRGQFDGVEVWLYLPEAFLPLNIGEGSFDPQTNLLIMPIHAASGIVSWVIDGNAVPPYGIQIEIHVNGQTILSISHQLGERGPDFVAARGGEAHGFNQHVKVSFPDGALPEDADVTVRAPQNTELNLGGRPMMLTAVGRQSKKEINQFNQPVTITVQYSDEEAARLLKAAGMNDENSLSLFYYDENEKTWYPLETTVNTETNQLVATTNHFTLFDFKAQNWEAARLPSLDRFQLSGFTGAATYSYPIEVPPGPGGLQPTLELSYNTQEVDSASSRTQASWVGMGWSLDTGYIQRNMNGTPNDLGDDTFSLVMNGVGGLLLPIADQDSDPNTIDYHLANENFWQIRQYLARGNVGGYPGDYSKWVVFAPDGTQYYFGNYADEGLGGHAWYPAYPSGCSSVTMETWRWGLTRTRNIFGKELTYNYNYEMAPNQKYYGSCSGYPAAMYVAAYPDSIIYPNNRYRIVFVREGGPNGVGNRTDYDTAWNAAQSTMLYMRSKLLQIEVWQDPNGTWNSGDEVLVRKYVLGYGENGQQVFPGVTWPAGGKAPTLTSITEYGLNGTNSLPKMNFYYYNMHFKYMENGYGGKINYYVNFWHANDGFDSYLFHPEGVNYNGPGDFYPDENGVNELDLLTQYFQPGTYYKIVADIWWNSGGTAVKLGLDDGTSKVYADPVDLTPGQWKTITSYVMTSGAASQARALLYCAGSCKLGRYEVFPLVTRAQISSKVVTDEVTNMTYTTQYSYEGAAVNDSSHSDYVTADPGGAHLLTKPNMEYRGNSHVTETDPDGKVVETWYYQDDVYKGQAYLTQVKNSNGILYTQANSYYNYQETPTYNLPHPQGQLPDSDLKILWIFTTAEENRIYNGDSTYVATRDEYQYVVSDQYGSQFGNRTRTISYSWDGYEWVTYRGSLTHYFPKVYNNTTTKKPEDSRFLTGLKAYTNTYVCNTSCNFSDVSALLSGYKWLYDDHTDYTAIPDNGVITGERNLIYYATPPRTDPRYADIKYDYDAWGNRTTVTQYTGATDINSFSLGSGAQSTHTCYGSGETLNGHLCSEDYYYTYPEWVLNAKNQQTNLNYDKAKGVPLSLTDPNAAITSATYDDFGRILTITRPGDTTYSTAVMSYHNAANPYSYNPFWTEAKQLISGSTYYVIRKYYNGIGQLLQTQVVGATIGTQTRDILTDTFYEAGGRVSQQTVPYDVATGFYYHQQNTSAPSTGTTYDVLGRIITTTATDGSYSSQSYWDGYVNNIPYLYSRVTNPRNNQTTTQSDIWGRVVKVTPPTGPSVSYTYDAADRLLTTTRGNSVTTLNYDFSGRKTSMADPDMGNWSYTYDALNNMVTQTDARDGGGCTTTLSYDPVNRLTGKAYSGNCGTTTASVTYTYDSGTNGIGLRTSMSDGSGSASWVYDNRGRMTQETKVITGGGTFKTQWTYNSADLVSSMTYPGNNSGGLGEVVNFTYLKQMLVDTVTGTNTYVNNTDYDASGRVDARDLGFYNNNPVINIDYIYYNWTDVNGQGRLKEIKSGVPGNPTSLQDLTYTYDENGNVKTILDAKNSNQKQCFLYDSLDRLTRGTTQLSDPFCNVTHAGNGTYDESYAYDGTTGNLSSKAGVSYTYGDASHAHAVTAAGSNSYTYDKNGNQVTRNVGSNSYTLSYDAENRLVSVSGTATATFLYDGDGKRVMGTVNSTTIAYIGDYYEYTVTNSSTRKFYYAGSARVAMYSSTTTQKFILGDYLGSTMITTNGSGVLGSQTLYYPWGTIRYWSGSIPTTFQFTGQRVEGYLGLYFYNSRWYDNALGRFVQADQIIVDPNNSQSLDRYAYTINNPVRYTDPTGHITQSEDQDAQQILQQLLAYDVTIMVDWGMKGEKWADGLWTLTELHTVLDSVQDLANAMGGADNFKTNLGGVTISQKRMKYGGVGKAHDVTMNANGFSKWAVVHELNHAWDGANGWDLSEDMRSSLGAGFDHPILHFLFPNNSAFWYDPGQGPPPAGLDANFNAKEDFAESVTAFVYPGEASNAASNRGWPYNDSSRGYRYSSFLNTPRGQYIYALMVSSP